MKLNSALFDVLPRVMWIAHVAGIFAASHFIFKEKHQISDEITLLILSAFLLFIGTSIFFYSGYYVLRYRERFSATKVVNEGPFGLVRHPMYVGIYLMLLGIGFVLSSIAIFVVSLSMLPIWIIECYVEENRMIELFGDDYIEYRSRVGMFFPRLRSN
ncbi:MAG: methyltransferase family protein [Candidatus Thorarchaeota archaeon]